MPPVVTRTSSGEPIGILFVCPELLGDELQQPRHAGRLHVVAAVLVDGPPHRVLDRVRRVEAHVSLIEAKRILDAVHHVADADDAGQGDGVDELGHGE